MQRKVHKWVRCPVKHVTSIPKGTYLPIGIGGLCTYQAVKLFNYYTVGLELSSRRIKAKWPTLREGKS